MLAAGARSTFSSIPCRAGHPLSTRCATNSLNSLFDDEKMVFEADDSHCRAALNEVSAEGFGGPQLAAGEHRTIWL